MSEHPDPTDFGTPREAEATRASADEKPKLWIGPLIFLVVVLTPALILVFSNTESVPVSWAGFEWEAPLWIVLAITFVAGAIVTRLFGWLWRTWRRHRTRVKREYDEVRRAGGR